MQERQDITDTNLRRRSGALCAQERLKSNQLLSQSHELLVADLAAHAAEGADEAYDGHDADGHLRPLFEASPAIWQARVDLHLPVELHMAPVQRLNRTTESFTDDECWSQFRFRRADLQVLYEHLHLPPTVVLSNESKFTGEEAMCITLYRLAHTGRLTEVKSVFGREESQLSRAINFVIRHLHRQFNCLLSKSLALWAPY